MFGGALWIGRSGPCRERAPAIIVSDIEMPTMTGYEFCKAVKQDSNYEDPLVLLSTLSDPLDIIKGLDAGADNYVTKPYEPDYLIDELLLLETPLAVDEGADQTIDVALLVKHSKSTLGVSRF